MGRPKKTGLEQKLADWRAKQLKAELDRLAEQEAKEGHKDPRTRAISRYVENHNRKREQASNLIDQTDRSLLDSGLRLHAIGIRSKLERLRETFHADPLCTDPDTAARAAYLEGYRRARAAEWWSLDEVDDHLKRLDRALRLHAMFIEDLDRYAEAKDSTGALAAAKSKYFKNLKAALARDGEKATKSDLRLLDCALSISLTDPAAAAIEEYNWDPDRVSKAIPNEHTWEKWLTSITHPKDITESALNDKLRRPNRGRRKK